jgi:hypothetical protein
VSDGFVTVNQEFTITVENTNDLPEFTSTPLTSAIQDVDYSYQATFVDIDVGDILSISGEYPDWLTLVDNGDGNAGLNGTPTNDDVGDHAVVLTVYDGMVTVNQEFTINVENINDSPEFTSDPVESVLEDEEYGYAITAEDLDEDDVLTISGEYPDWLMLVFHSIKRFHHHYPPTLANRDILLR